jgi:hypothetical protein
VSSAPRECGPASNAFQQIWRVWYALNLSVPHCGLFGQLPHLTFIPNQIAEPII